MSRTIRYTSPNGYSGVLYGKSSMSIYNPDGTESLHTGRRVINTYEELKERVDSYPEFAESLEEFWKEHWANGNNIRTES